MGVRFGPGNLRFGIMHGLEGSTYRSFFAAESRRQQRTRGKRRLGNERRCSTWSWRRLCMSKIVPSMWYSKRFPEFQFSTSIHLLVGVILLQQSDLSVSLGQVFALQFLLSLHRSYFQPRERKKGSIIMPCHAAMHVNILPNLFLLLRNVN
jgi:hypothetical protein